MADHMNSHASLKPTGDLGHGVGVTGKTPITVIQDDETDNWKGKEQPLAGLAIDPLGRKIWRESMATGNRLQQVSLE